MRCASFILLIAVAVCSAEVDVNPKFRPALNSQEKAQVYQKLSETEEFQNIVDYLNENASGNDMVDIIECFSDILDDVSPMERSVGNVVDELFHEIPWGRINKYVQGKMAEHPKFAKIYSMLNDPKFKDLLNKAVNSQALRDYAKSVQANGFTFSAFVTFAFKVICDTAIVSHHDVYSEGVCLALSHL